MTSVNGAQSLVATLAQEGVEICFANPGTSEMHFLAALDTPRLRSVLVLFEGIATGAADGWWRMRRAPACTLLHLGPGLANGLANLHNAKRASSGIVNLIGEHATDHLRYDAPLTSDIEGLARPLSHWVRRAAAPATVAADAREAVAEARQIPGRIATLILPGDVSWGELPATSTNTLHASTNTNRPHPPPAHIDAAARALQSGEPTLIILGGEATRGPALHHAGRLAAHTGCRLATQFFTARLERGAGRVPLERIPYYVPAALDFLQGFRHLITVETGEPIAFFRFPDKPSQLKPPGCQVHSLATLHENGAAALEALAAATGATNAKPFLQPGTPTAPPSGPLNPRSIAQALAAALPENAILVDESLTTGRETLGLTAAAPPHDVLQNMGGSIGFSTPVATGAALACPDRRVICMVGDGSALYTLQSLWTQARENLNVTTLIFANHSYQILKTEYANMGFGTPGERALSMMDIGQPRIDWVALGQGLGVPSVRVTTAQDLHRHLAEGVQEPGPRLIEVLLA